MRIERIKLDTENLTFNAVFELQLVMALRLSDITQLDTCVCTEE
jgi:hypothetical protein